MADRTQRINPKTLDKDIEAFAALKTMTDYKPANTDLTVEKVETTKGEMEQLQEEETQMMSQLSGLRDRIRAKEWEFHDKITGVKDQVKAQYGRNSDQIQALGLTKASEIRRRSTAKSNGGNSPNR